MYVTLFGCKYTTFALLCHSLSLVSGGCELLLNITVWYKSNYLLLETDTLLLDEQANKYRALASWFETPQGSRVAHAFASELLQVSEQFNGGTLLQLGSCGENLWLQSLKFRHKWVISPGVLEQKNTLITSLNMLPIERDSVDCVIAPLTIEAFPRDKNPIDEIDRILKPMGYAIFFGINPCSFWGAALRWKRLTCFGKSAVTLASSLTLKRTMLLRGYRQCALTSFYYIPPVTSEFMIRTLEFFNEMGKMVWPFPAAFYCFIAQKYQACPPNLLVEVANNEILVEPKSSLQAISKWMHE